MKVLYFGPITPKGKPSIGGYEAANRKNIEALVKRGVEVVEFPNPVINKRFGKLGKLAYLKLFLLPLGLWKYRKQTDVILHTTPLYGNLLLPSLFTVRIAKCLGIHVLVDVRAGSLIYYYKTKGTGWQRQMKKLLEQADMITVEGSSYIQQIKTIIGIDKASYYFPNIADCTDLAVIDKPKDKINIFYFGRLTKTKGIDLILEVIKKLDGKGIVVEITGLKDASPVIERHRGFYEVMKNYPGIKVVTLESNWKLERAQELMKQYLDKGGHADGVFGHSDLGAIGAFLEAERRGIDKQMLIVGIDGLPGEWEGVDRVKRGQFAASYVYPTQGEKIMELAMNILQGKPYKKDNVMKSFLATSENCDAIALQYQDLEAKMKNLDQISDSLDSYSEVSRIQQWMIIVAVVIVLVLLIIIFYIYKVYRKKLQKQKAVAHGFIENKEGWAAELNHLDESDRYFMDRFKKKILDNMGNADMKMDDLGAEMQLSKVQLYRKVKAMTGKTPVELLKEMRLQRAYTLLMQTDKTVAEVSAEVGFALPGYFSSCFKKQFGVLPTDFRNEQASKKK